MLSTSVTKQFPAEMKVKDNIRTVKGLYRTQSLQLRRAACVFLGLAQRDCCSISSNAAPACHGAERAESEGEAPDLLTELCSSPQLWFWSLGSD